MLEMRSQWACRFHGRARHAAYIDVNLLMQDLVSALASGNAVAAGQAYAAALNAGGSIAAAATTAMASAIATANCNGVIVTAIASEPAHGRQPT